MRRAIVTAGLAFALALPLFARAAPVVTSSAQPSTTSTDGTAKQGVQAPDPLAAKVHDAARLIGAQRPLEAIPILDGVIAAEQSKYAAEKRAIYAAMSLTETLMYMVTAAKDHRPAIVIDSTWPDALFLKGFALIDAQRREEGGAYLKQALVLSPLNSHYLNESAEFQKHDRDFAGALATFRLAADDVQFAPESVKGAELRRAWRGMAYVYAEQGKYDEAEALYRKCLVADPGDKGATAELGWIAEQRQKMAN